ncbi:unnamed protein product [Diamesa hyperborea]
MVRNCFLPGCDRICRSSPLLQRRRMFMPKNGQQFDDWKKMLEEYGNRPFKTHDRVCARHFKEEDIDLYWETMIKGEIHKTPRDKAKLKDGAMPTENLIGQEKKKKTERRPLPTEVKETKNLVPENIVEVIKTRKRKTEPVEINEFVIEKTNVIRKYSKVLDNGDKFEITELTVGSRMQMSDQDNLITPIEEPIDSPNGIDSPGSIKIITEEDKNEMMENLNILWDEAFDITLPSQLWGIQRCPERTFIVFSEFNKSKMKSSKLLYVDNEFQYKIFIDDKEMLVKSLEKHEINTEFFSNLLNDFDENRIP